MITWKAITAECDGYRNGFVAVFRKYEGQDTDKKDAQGRTIKVTQRSFADHLGLGSEATFRRWIKTAESGAALSGRAAGGATGTARTGQVGRQIAKSPTVSVDDKVGMLSDLLSDKNVTRAWRETQAPNVTAAQAKAAAAMAHAVTAPIMNAVGEMEATGVWVGQLNDIASAIGEYDLTSDTVRKLRKAVDRVSGEVQVQEFRLGMEVAL